MSMAAMTANTPPRLITVLAAPAVTGAVGTVETGVVVAADALLVENAKVVVAWMLEELDSLSVTVPVAETVLLDLPVG